MEEVETTEQIGTVLAISYSALVMGLTVLIAVFLNALRTFKADFEFMPYFRGNARRFVVGGVVVVALSVMMTISEDFGALLQAIGFNVEKTPVALGAAVALLLITGMSGKPEEE